MGRFFGGPMGRVVRCDDVDSARPQSFAQGGNVVLVTCWRRGFQIGAEPVVILLGEEKALRCRFDAGIGHVAHTLPGRNAKAGIYLPYVNAGSRLSGRESLQAVEIPPQYATVARTVMVEPPHLVREVVPAQYGTVARTELVSAPHTVWVPADQY